MTRVLIPLARGCEELEAVTIIDLMRRAGIEVITAGLDDQVVTASRGVRLIPDAQLDEVMEQEFDMLVLPGGLPGADYLDEDKRIHALLKRMAKSGGYTAAICAAPRVLAHAGLLNGKRATSYPGIIDNMELQSTEISQDAVVIDGKVVTSRGPGTAMEFALTLIAQLLGEEKRREVEQALVCSSA